MNRGGVEDYANAGFVTYNEGENEESKMDGMEAYAESLNHRSDNEAVQAPKASSECPVCGVNTPHPHSQEDLVSRIVALKRALPAPSAPHAERTYVSVPRDTAILNWLEENHYFNGAEGTDNSSFTWKFYTPNNGRQWQPIRDKISEAMLRAATGKESE